MRRFARSTELAEAIRLEPADTFFINLVEPTTQSYQLYRSLHHSGSRYAVITANAIPAIEEIGKELVSEKVRRLHRLLLRPKELFMRIAGKIRQLVTNSLSGPSSGASLWIAGGTRSVAAGASYPRSRLTRTIWAHALDYDSYLAAGAPLAHSDGTIVFLDSYLPHHPDYAGEDLPPLDAVRYYASLRRLFDDIEDHLELRVLIAAHPRAEYSDETLFGGRPIIKDRTADLVRKSALVLAHWSTAISHAVLYEKPIVLLTANAFQGRQESRFIVAMADWLGSRPVNIDEPVSVDWSEQLSVNRKAYRAYRAAFIKKEGSPELPFWQIVADAIRADLERSEGSAA